MRIAIISDVHANLAALEPIQEPYDVLLCLGDLVDYGPQPRETIQWVKARALRVIRGNHDHALANGVDCRCAPVMQEADGDSLRLVTAYGNRVLGCLAAWLCTDIALCAKKTVVNHWPSIITSGFAAQSSSQHSVW